MCGVAFIHNPIQEPGALASRMQSALRAMQHRGPDEGAQRSGEHWCIGHRRLSIVDLAGSHQPMTDPDGRFWLAYNGEIYNYRELRESLADRWRFTTAGDTEVVLAGLVLEEVRFFQRMEGMWALALWDTQAKRLLLSRDRMGKKPLYYESRSNTLICASELPSLRHLASTPWSEDPDSTADYLRYGFYLPGTTAYHGVREVLPGHWLNWSPDGPTEEQAYWSLNPGSFSGNRETAIERLRETLAKAVERRLVADVEVGAFLSGGVDSSLISALAQAHLDRPLRTFTMGFSEAAFDERTYARQVAEHLGTRHTEDLFPLGSPEAAEKLIFDHVGQPFADVSILPTAGISALAARDVKVVLSGDGGDELFSGYQRYQARQILRWYTRLPAALRKSAETAINLLPEPTAHHSRSILKKAHLFTRIVERLESETPYVCARMFSDAELAKLAPDLVGRGHPPPGILSETRLDDLPRMMFADALVYLPQDILLKVDRASMAHGLEARAPFLDREVVELAFSLPAGWHRNYYEGKRLLYAAFSGLLPKRIWQRRKQGFGVPVHAWMRGTTGDRMNRLLVESAGPVSREFLLNLLEKHRSGSRDQGLRLWSLYVLLLQQAKQ